MRSIRLSLVVYFLVLLAIALGAVSVLVYRITETSLRARQQEMATLLRDRHRTRVDDLLRQEALNLANFVRLQGDQSDRRSISLHGLGLLSAGLAPDAVGAIPLWACEAIDFRWHFGLRMIRGPKLKVRELNLPLDEGQLIQFVQVNSQSGAEWRSPSMGESAFPFQREDFPASRVVDWKFDTTHLNGMAVRRVAMRVAHFQIDWAPPPPRMPPPERPPLLENEEKGQRGEKGPRRGGFPRRPDWWRGVITFKGPPPQPTIYIQCAYNTARHDGLLGRMEEELEKNVARLEDSTQETLHGLQQTLLLLTGATFTAAFLGVFLLVWLGLLPLRKLSDAVSQVSAKDFRLPLDSKRMPAELQPIVGRLQQTLDLLKRTFAREKQAAADISHELRTPLAALLTTIEVTLRKQRAAEDYREVLEEVRTSGQHMYGLVERLLTLARLDAGADHLRPREVDVKALAEQCASLVRPLAEARGLKLQVHTNGPTCMHADPDKLREVFTNLLHNAIEYNRPQGSIDLEVQRDNGDVRIEVKDTGIGISAEARQLIFQRFYRSDPSRAAEGLHAGLGLAIVKGYVDLMGGKIDVDSTEGQGSTFRLRLPVEPVA